MVPVGAQHAAALLYRILGDKVDRPAQARNPEPRGHIGLVHLDLFHLVQVYRAEVHRTPARIVQRNAIHANQYIPCGNPADRYRLETPVASLPVRLDSRESRKQVRRRKHLAFPCGRGNFGVVRVFCRHVFFDTCNLRHSQILRGCGFFNGDIFGRLRNLRVGTNPCTAQKHRRYSGFAE